MKKIFLTGMVFFGSSISAHKNLHFERLSLAIDDSDVIKTKNLVRQLDDLELSPEERKKIFSSLVSHASVVVKERDKLSVFYSFGDIIKALWGICCFDSAWKSFKVNTTGITRLHTMSQGVVNLLWGCYLLKKGMECSNQRAELDKAYRIKEWLTKVNYRALKGAACESSC